VAFSHGLSFQVETVLIWGLSLGASDVAIGKDVRDIELRRLFEPTVAEQRAETSGRIYISECRH